jgi:hypothetical protein
MEVVLVSTPGDYAKIALWYTFERSRKVRDLTIVTSEQLKSVQETSVVIGSYATKSS